MLLTLLRHETQKPPVGPLELDLTNPITQGLYVALPMNEYGSKLPNEWARRVTPGILGAGMAWSSTKLGPAMKGANNSNADYLKIDVIHQEATDFSRAVLVVPKTLTTQGFCATRNTNGTDTSTYERSIGIDGSSKFQWYIYDGSPRTATSSASAVAGTPYMLVGTHLGGNMYLYVNGVQDGTSVCNSAFTGYSNPGMSFGWGALSGNGNVPTDADMVGVWDWTRALSAVEVAEFSAEPYAMFRMRPIQQWFSFAGLPIPKRTVSVNQAVNRASTY